MSEANWFSGPVQDAVSLVNQRNCVFIVYIYDGSDKSSILETTLSDREVTESMRNCAVALRFEKDSENAKFFSQFYPVQTVPALYFIKQGVIKAFGTETITQQEILDKIKAASVECQTGVPQTTETPTQSTENNSIAEDERESLAAKKAEMQLRLENARKQREEKEKKEAKEKEIKRRNEAKTMQEAKQIQADKENKVFMEKLRKDKKEAEEHKRRVREQIARDRTEKLAEKKREQKSLNSYSKPNHEISATKRQSLEFSNLNIRLLDGSTIRHQFESSITLSDVKDWIQENRTDGSKDYKLSSQFPTRLFTENDANSTLHSLNLCPSATIIMKPIYKSTPSLSQQTRGDIGISSLARSGNGNRSLSSDQQPFVRNLRGGHRLGGPSSSDAGISTAVADNGQRRHPFSNRINTIHDENGSEDDKEKRPTYNGNSVNHE